MKMYLRAVPSPSDGHAAHAPSQIGLKTRQFIKMEDDADGGTAPATMVRPHTIMRTVAASDHLVTQADLWRCSREHDCAGRRILRREQCRCADHAEQVQKRCTERR